MHVKPYLKRFWTAEKGLWNFFWSIIPLDCPICDQAGECRLQEFATDYGRGYSSYVERKMSNPSVPVWGQELPWTMSVVFYVQGASGFVRKLPKMMCWDL